MTRLLLITLFTCFSAVAFSQKTNISGTVVNKTSQTPLPGATVSVVNGTQKSGTETYGFSEITSSARVLYRLKMYDVDSKAEYSKTLVFTTENSNQRSLKVVTNPVKEKLVISFTNTGSEVAQVNIYDNLGRIMQRQSLNAVEGVNTSTIALNANYRPGLYIVELITKAGKLSEKLIYSNQ